MSSNKYTVKIPRYVEIFYCEKRNLLVGKSLTKQKSIYLKVKLLISANEKLLSVTDKPFKNISTNQIKKLKSLQGTTVALIKQLFLELTTEFYKKLNLVGIGFRAFDVENFEKQALQFKLGFSHTLYFNVPKTVKIQSLKFTKLFLYGNSYYEISQLASFIRSYKKPEPYKGKGILYENEKIILKEGKKA